MPEDVNDKKVFSLLEVTLSIQKTLSERYTTSFWVKAEMNKMNYYPHSGHCYPDLVEKKGAKVIAQLKSTLWKDDYLRINRNFLKVVKTPLKDGIKILFCAKIIFDPTHGLSLRIIDIDPSFSLGELEREKQETIEQLQKEGIFNRNRLHAFPLLPKRIAVISVQTSKGYADFVKVIDQNPWGYNFFHMLFPSLLQGDKAIESILYQLSRIRKVISHFDVVAIIRGGGGEVGLSSFNNFKLSKAVALFPIPVITGIGHATNETVTEMVAFKNAITPTDLADYLLQKFHDFSLPLQRAEGNLTGKVQKIISDEYLRLHHTTRYFRSFTRNILIRSQHAIQNNAQSLFQQSNSLVQKEKAAHATMVFGIRSNALSQCSLMQQRLKQTVISLKKNAASDIKQKTRHLENLEKSIDNMRPENVLKRGYTITTMNGKVIKSSNELKENDIIDTIFPDGTTRSEIRRKKAE